jgi:hypothetical protein
MSQSVVEQLRELVEQERTQFPDRLNAVSLGYKLLGDIVPGHLIYVDLGAGHLAVGMRLKRSGGAAEALVFNYATRRNEVIHALLTNLGNQRCIDWGMRPTVCWHHPLKQEGHDYSQAAEPGIILLTRDRLALRTYYGHGQGEPLYFDLKNGEEVDPEAEFTTIAEWSLGVQQVSGPFITLAAHPISK